MPQAPGQVSVEITQLVDESFPGWIECLLVDASGEQHRFIEKVSVLSEVDLGPTSAYPTPGAIRCVVLARQRTDSRPVFVLDTSMPDGAEPVLGQSRFEVKATQLAPRARTLGSDDIAAAHKHSSNHKLEIDASDRCGCFYCCEVFSPDAIEVWIDGCNDDADTALYPRCGIDSVIGSASGYPIEDAFLRRMRDYWF